MNPLNVQLALVPWEQFKTAYGLAFKVPQQIRRLAGTDQKEALAASHDLWCGLCHQHANVSSAALPALPFLLEVLDHADEQLTIEILDILLGFAVCTRPGRENTGTEPIADWVQELRAGVIAERPRLQQLAKHPNPDLADFAQAIMDAID